MKTLKLHDLTSEQVARLLSVCTSPAAAMPAELIERLFDLKSIVHPGKRAYASTDLVREWREANRLDPYDCMVTVEDDRIDVIAEPDACITVTRRENAYSVLVKFAPGREALEPEMRRAAAA